MKYAIQIPLTALAALLFLCGCAGSGGGSVPPSGGVREVPLRDPSSFRGPERGAGTVETFSEETRAFMEDGLRQFGRGDPAWPRTRARWLEMGTREADFLVYMLWTGLIRMQQLSQPQNVERARHELALIGAPAVTMLSQVLAGGTAFTMYDEIEEHDVDVKIDDLARREATEILTIIGPPAVESISDALDRSETKSGQKFALQTLGNMGDRGGAFAGATLANWARSTDWVIRVEAVHAMRTRSDVATRDALVQALGDDEGLVREKAADALALRRESAAAPALAQAASWARSVGKLREAARHDRALKAVRGRR